ncbi:lysophospholipid acyltransferase family protein [Pedobacter heparinus]|uniref:lysophospholipid acyltransferase family protein n=1 Tax=Pedobacter heparinus TaxID=984 RepID=UPI00292DF5ED|nr:lysophospholipid acyltransferase family protein [Pedobacter heparinus]
MVSILKQVHRVYSVFIILLFALLFYPFYYLSAKNTKTYGLLNRLRKLNSSMCAFFIGVIFRFSFEEPLSDDQTYIYCANHTSNLDIMILCCLARGRFHFMGKDELLKNPVLKIFFQTIDIPVNRESKISAFRAFKRAGENLEKGMSLIIFPEGRIDDEHYPPKLMSFKNGPFRLAIEKKTAIVPVSLTNIWKRMWDDGVKYGSTPGVCDIYIHKPVLTTNLTINDSDELKDRIFDLINSKLADK